jgi:chromosome segregation ATPase
MDDKTLKNKFNNIDKRFVSIDKRFANIDKQFKELNKRMDSKFIEIDKRFDAIDEKIKGLPGLYDKLDNFMVEIVENRQERIFINNRLEDHEHRIYKLEKTAG